MSGANSPDFLDQLVARAAREPKRIVFPEGADPRVLRAVTTLAAEGAARPVLIGPSAEWARWQAANRSDGDAELLDPGDADLIERTRAHLEARRAGKDDPPERLTAWAADPLHQAAALVAAGDADGVVAGCVRTTADVVRAGLIGIGLEAGLRTLSSAFYMVFGPDHPVGPRVLTFTDAGVVPYPSAAQLADIAAAAVRARGRIVGDDPRVGFLSFSTKGSAEGESVSAVREAVRIFREKLPDVPADGELQGDAALRPEVAVRKAPGSSIAGDANVLVFPDLDAANIAYKLVQRLAGAVALGPILQGLRAPMNDLSRGASADDIRLVACITALQSG